MISSSLIFLFFDLCYETGGPDVGKSHLLNRYVNGNSHDTETVREGKKTFNNEHKNDQMISYKVQQSKSLAMFICPFSENPS